MDLGDELRTLVGKEEGSGWLRKVFNFQNRERAQRRR